MSITHEWYDETKNLVVITLRGRVEYEEYYAGDERMCAMLDSVDHPVDVICDYSHQFYFAPGYGSLMKDMVSIFRPNLRSAIFVGNKFAWELFDTFTKYFKEVDFICTYEETMEQAQLVLDQIRAGIPIEAPHPSDPSWN